MVLECVHRRACAAERDGQDAVQQRLTASLPGLGSPPGIRGAARSPCWGPTTEMLRLNKTSLMCSAEANSGEHISVTASDTYSIRASAITQVSRWQCHLEAERRRHRQHGLLVTKAAGCERLGGVLEVIGRHGRHRQSRHRPGVQRHPLVGGARRTQRRRVVGALPAGAGRRRRRRRSLLVAGLLPVLVCGCVLERQLALRQVLVLGRRVVTVIAECMPRGAGGSVTCRSDRRSRIVWQRVQRLCLC